MLGGAQQMSSFVEQQPLPSPDEGTTVGAERREAAMMATWIATVDRLPEAGVPVLVTLLTPTPSVVLAQYAPAKALRMHPDADEGGVYDEAQDEYFAEIGRASC